MKVDHFAIAWPYIEALKSNYDTFKSWSVQAIHLTLVMAMMDVERQMASQVKLYVDAELQIDFLDRWIADNHPNALDTDADTANMAVKLIQRFRNLADCRAQDIEALQVATNAEVSQLTADIAERDRQIGYQRGRIMELETQADGLRTSITEQDAEIQRQRDEIQRLTVRCQALAAQLEVANSPVSGNEASFVTNGSAPAAIDWSGAPKEYLNSINKLNAGTLPGWTILTAPQRRAIALYAVRQLAGFDSLSMAQFDAARPSWMPSASAVCKLFGTGWIEVVRQAVAHA